MHNHGINSQLLQHFLLKCHPFFNSDLTLIDLSQMWYKVAGLFLQILAELIRDRILQDVDAGDINIDFGEFFKLGDLILSKVEVAK